MNSHTRRRDDRSAPPADPFKQWVPTDRYPPDRDSERRRNRSTTLPSHSYDPRSNPSHDARYNDPRPPRSHRQDPHYPPATSYAYHHSSAHAPSTSKAYQQATRSSAQHSSSGHHYPQPSPYHPPQPTPTYQVASSSRRQRTDAPDPGASRRPPLSTHQSPYDQLSTAEDMPRSSARPSRAVHSSLRPSYSAPANQTFWNPPQESSLRRYKDAYRDSGREPDRERDREREKEKERDKSTAELENRYKDRARAERYRERERERATEVRYQDSSRSRHHDKRKDSDSEGVLYSEQRNASKVSLSGKEAREPGNGHRRYRTEDGTASTARRHQPENTQNPIATIPPHSTSVPPADVQQTGEPPPAPRVMPVYLPPKGKSQRSHREGRPSTAQGAQSGSDTERAIGKHRMERAPSGPAAQRSDTHTSTSARDRGNRDLQTGPQDDVKRPEGKYRVHPDTRQPLAQINVDIPLVTPGFNASALPTDTRTSTAPQIVSIRAGQGPSDPHDAHFKSSAISHSATSQEIDHPLHPPPASIVKSSNHNRSYYPSEVRAQSDRPPVTVENSRTEPHGDDLPPGPRVSIHESSRAFPTPMSKPYARGNPETAVDISSSSYVHSRPPSRPTHRTSANNIVPPAVIGPRPPRSISQGLQTNEPPTSVIHHASTVSSIPNQQSVPPSPARPINSSPPMAEHSPSSLSFVQPSPKYAQLHGVSPSHSTSTQQALSVLPSVHPTPTVVSRTLTAPFRPSTQDSTYADAPYAHQQLKDQQSASNDHPEFQQTSNSTTVKASWVVQTPATTKRTGISREEKYLRDHHSDLETRQAQLRQVLSQDSELFRRASSSVMKISQATTPSALSQRNSPGTKARDAPYGTPRGTSAGNSPKSGPTKEAHTPEHVLRRNLPHHAGAPHIAVVGSTPVTTACDLSLGHVDHALLAPPFPAPIRAARTTSGSQGQPQPSQPAVRNTSPTSYQSQLVPAVHAPSLFQPYQSPSPPAPDYGGRFSPPPLPIPPPRGLGDSPPLPIETRTSEIIPMRTHSAGVAENDVRSAPDGQSEMLHIPSQPSSTVPLHVTQPQKTSQGDSDMAPTAISNDVVAAHSDARFQNRAFTLPDDVPIAHQEIMRSVSIVSTQSLAPTRPRPKVTVEDIPEDSLVFGKGTPTNIPITPSVSALRPSQSSQNTSISNASLMSKSAVVDPPGHKSSPQSKSKDPSLHRNTELSAISTTPPMPAPTLVAAPISARVSFSVPPTQPIFPPSSHLAPTPRATSHAVSSRISQRAAEMLQASKSSTPAGAIPGATGNVNKSTIVPIETTHNPVCTATNQSQPPNVASVQGPLASRPVNALTMTATLPNTSVASMTKAAMLTTTSSSGPPVGTPGLHASGSSNSTQPPFASDPFRHQPSRLGAVSIPSVDTTSTTVTPTATSKSAHPEQPIPESARFREVASSPIRNAAPSHIYPNFTRPGPSSAFTQQTSVAPTQPSTHYRTVSLPVTSSSAVQKPPSPRKYSEPISSTTVSTQPFPSRPSAPEPQSVRAAISGHLSVPAPVRSARLPPLEHASDFDMLKTPSSIAPSPMLNSDSVPQSIPAPIRTRQTSTDSKDDKKKASGLFGLFRTRTLSSKAADPPAVSSVSGASLDKGRAHPDASVGHSIATPVLREATSTSVPKELYSVPPPVPPTATRTGPQSKLKGRVPDPATNPPPTQTAREHKEATPHLFTPFKFLTMHSKRNRTVSAASLDVCDGYTATTTVIGSPDHSTVSQAQALPAIMPLDVRDPLAATSEWRDREEADRRELRTHRVRRPGVTFDLEEEPPSPAPGTTSKRKKLVRRPSGRAPTPGPPRG